MYCKNCGYKLDEDSKFCSNCGSPVNKIKEPENDIKAEISASSIVENDTSTANELCYPPSSLLKCDILKMEGKKNLFFDENNNEIIKMNRTPDSKLFNVTIEYKALNDSGEYKKFMSAKETAEHTLTAYDNDGEIIGIAAYKDSLLNILNPAPKTIINIKSKDGQEYTLEEQMSLLKGLKKAAALPGTGIDKLMDARTGAMDIKKGNEIIGKIDSMRGALNNTYVARNCDSIRKKMDIRLLILGMRVKFLYVK